VYLRLHEGQKLDEIPEEVLEECCQLVKANSIEVLIFDLIELIHLWRFMVDLGMQARVCGWYDSQ